jgi:hypothetical protein
MTIKDLLKIHLGDAVNISNKPFIYVGHTQIDLDDGQTIRWLYDDEGSMLSVSREDEEIIFFNEIEEELEPDGETIVYANKEYEFSFEDMGEIANVEGERKTDIFILITRQQTEMFCGLLITRQQERGFRIMANTFQKTILLLCEAGEKFDKIRRLKKPFLSLLVCSPIR